MREVEKTSNIIEFCSILRSIQLCRIVLVEPDWSEILLTMEGLPASESSRHEIVVQPFSPLSLPNDILVIQFVHRMCTRLLLYYTLHAGFGI